MVKKKKTSGPDFTRALHSKRREEFCELYAFEFWEDPAQAAVRANYKLTPSRLRMLLSDPQIMGRVRYLRKTLGDRTVADEAWIKDRFVQIARNADKVTDQLRALSSLYRAVVESEHLSRNGAEGKESPLSASDILSSLSFDGEEDI